MFTSYKDYTNTTKKYIRLSKSKFDARVSLRLECAEI